MLRMLPEILANATDLAAWAERLDARRDLPRILLRLIYASGVPIEQIEFLVERLITVDVGLFAAEDRTAVWDALRETISRHREFPDAKWAMLKEAVDRLQQAYERFAPDDLISLRSGFFSITPKLLSSPGRDWRARHESLERERTEAVRELHDGGGLPLLLDFAAAVERPEEVGFTAGRHGMLEDEEGDIVWRVLASESGPAKAFARGFVTGRFSSLGWDWVEARLEGGAASAWTPEQRADFLASLSFEARTWDLLEPMDDETKCLYWSRAPTFGLPSREDSERAALKLIEYGRPHVAIDFIALYTEEEGLSLIHISEPTRPY